MKKTLNNDTHTASVEPNPKIGQQPIKYHISLRSPSAKLAEILATPKNNRSYEERSAFIKR